MNLGKAQRSVIDALDPYGWNERETAWVFRSRVNTVKILDSLCKKGLVMKDASGWYKLKTNTTNTQQRGR